MADSAEPSHVVASGLTIVDSRGKRRATLNTIGELEKPSFRLYDSEGLERVVIGLNENDMPGFSLLKPDAKQIVGIGIDGIGNTGIAVFNAAGVPIITIQVSDYGDGDVTIYDSRTGGALSMREMQNP